MFSTSTRKPADEELKRENQKLKNLLEEKNDQLREAQETLDAIRSGAVDGLVRSTPEGEQVFILKGADQPYRNLIEEMSEGAVLLSDSGAILYCNSGFARMVGVPLDRLIGCSIRTLVSVSSAKEIEKLLSGPSKKPEVLDISFQTTKHQVVPTQVSTGKIPMDSLNVTALIITDLTKHMGEDVKRYTADLEHEITERKKAEGELAQSEERFRIALKNSPVSLAAQDLNHRYIWAYNQKTARPEAIIGHTDKEIFKPDEAARIDEIKERVLREGVELREQMWLDRPSGKIYLDITWTPLRDTAGKIFGITSATVDLTEQKLAEIALKERTEQLEQTQEKLEAKAAEVEEYATRMEELVEVRTNAVRKQASLIDLTPDAIMVREFDGTISFWSAGAEKLYGWTAKEAIGQISHKLLKTIFPISLADIIDDIRVAGFWSGELLQKTKDGHKIIVESRWLSEKTRAGKIIDILESNVDITERKKAEAAVLSERKRLFDVLETMPAMICLITADYQIIFANRSFRERFGESKGRPCYEYCWGKSEPCEFCESLVPFKTGKPHHWEVTGPDGSVIEAHDYPFTDIDGKQLVLEMDMDITSRKKAEAEAVESARKLKDSERLAAIGATAGMVGHDIRNPLQAIIGDLFLAKQELEAMSDGEPKRIVLESILEIEKNTEYINKIVQDLQDYARPVNPKVEESNLEQVFEVILKKNDIPNNVHVTVSIAKDATKLWADAYYLNRIMSNLISNAVQAMPQGGKLKIEAHKEKEETVITVEDTGVGIPKGIQTKMFNVMFTTKSKGQGFGLPVVKRMTESLGGTVSFESEEGKGTKFTLRLSPQRDKQ